MFVAYYLTLFEYKRYASIFTKSSTIFEIPIEGMWSNAPGKNATNDILEPLTCQVLKQQDDHTSRSIIKLLEDDPNFLELSLQEGKNIVERDNLDNDKLARGVEHAVKANVLVPITNVEPVTEIRVYGKNSSQIVEEILQGLSHISHNLPLDQSNEKGRIILFQGLSGTGKGTTVRRLARRLSRAVTWSNGNVFRALTYCVLDELPQEELNQAAKDSRLVVNPSLLTHDLVQRCMNRISLLLEESEDVSPRCDIVICPREGSKDAPLYVSQIAHTILQRPSIAQNVPLVAERSQGEVVQFTSQSMEKLSELRCHVLAEGRAQTLDYIRTPYRFELVMLGEADSTPSMECLLGQRRAAQRVMAATFKYLEENGLTECSPEDVIKNLHKVLSTMLS